MGNDSVQGSSEREPKRANDGVKSWGERTAFAGFDGAGEHHDVVVVEAGGVVVEDFRIDGSAEGWHQLRRRLSVYPDLAVTLEARRGAVVERLVDAGYAVFPVNPMAAKRYRERKAPSDLKTDRVDAWTLADALRTDGHAWRVLRPDDPLTVQLRTLQDHLDRSRARIEALFARHPDHDLFGSLPGVGPKLGPRLLSELGDDRGRFDSAEGLQCYVGTAPVTHQSGKRRTARFRRSCNPRRRRMKTRKALLQTQRTSTGTRK